MKLELKNVKFYESMSEETNCFQADLFINGKKIAYVKNTGQGGCTDYGCYDLKTQDFLREVEVYFKLMPMRRSEEFDFEYQPTLENEIDDLFEAWLKVKEDKKFLKQMEKGIMYGTKYSYKMIYWKGTTLTAMLQNPNGKLRVKQIVKDLKGKGETILNTNIPAELL